MEIGGQQLMRRPKHEACEQGCTCLASLSEEARNNIHQLIPLGRMGRPEEYASLAVYLASDEHYLVGQTISPNGGMVL